MMAKRDGLGGLQMRKARHHGRRVLCRPRRQRQHEVLDLELDGVDGVADKKAEIGGDLVVAAARGVQFSGGFSHDFGEAGFDVGVDVFQGFLKSEFSGFDFGGDLREAVINALDIRRVQDAGGFEHGGVGAGGGDVLAPELAVEAD